MIAMDGVASKCSALTRPTIVKNARAKASATCNSRR